MTIQFIPTDEQVMMRDGARRFTDQSHSAEAEPDALWSTFAELGWLMIALPEEHGGLGGDARDTAIIAEELGRGLVRLPFVEVAATAARVLITLAPERLEALASGEAKPIFAHDELGARGDPLWVETNAIRDGDGWLLTGRKTGIVGGPFADSFLVSAKVEGEGIGIFEIEADDAPLMRYAAIDNRPAGELRMENCSALRVGTGDASPVIIDAVDHALVIESAEMLGSMQAVLEMTRDYLNTRKQYGKELAQFQVLQHRLADMFIEIEQTRSITLRGLDALVHADPAERSRVVSAVRLFTAKAAHFVTAQGIQLHGGIGVTEEYPVGHHFRRMTAFALRHGTAEAHLDRYVTSGQSGV